MSKKVFYKLFAMTIIMVVAFTFQTSPVIAAGSEGEEFELFLEDEWKEIMESDYLTMHSSVMDPEKIGLEEPKPVLGEISYDSFEDEVVENRASLDKLHDFDFDKLDDKEKYDYLVYEKYLEDSIGLSGYPDMIEMFRPYTGYFSSYVNYFMDFALYDKKDVEDYLSLLEQFPGFIDNMMAFTSKQAERGYFLDAMSLDEACYYLDGFINKKESNDLIVTFDGNVSDLEGLSVEEINVFKDKAKEIVIDKIIPKVAEAKDLLISLDGSRSTGKSMYYLPGGKEYYEFLLSNEASTDKSCEEVFEYLTKAVKEINAYKEKLIADRGTNTGISTINGLSDLEDLMTYLGDHMEGFPSVPSLDYKISYLPENLDTGAMAYYLVFPVDDVSKNIIKVDKDETDDANSLYYTVAHEGLPGHMYQFSWYQSTGPNKIRHDIVVSGYEEGWANYVEKIMMDRAPIDWYSAELSVLEDMLFYMEVAACDVGVNGLGYGEARITDWLKEVNETEMTAEDMIYYAMTGPGDYLSYGYGSAKLWGLREQVQSALGDDFDEEEFHLKVLENGPRSLDIVEEDLKEYVKSKGKEFPSQFTFFASEKAPGEQQTGYSESGPISPFAAVVIVIGVIILAILLFVFRTKHKKTISD